jgi:phospholipid/cholesterol/gamma-HCH transport system substrate-binding protein
MNNNKKAVTVGIFIFLGLVIFIVGVLTLGGQKKTFEKKFTVKAIFDDVGGLQKGNNVWFSGVKVGTISDMTFTSDSKVEVEMSIETKVQKYIRKNAKAKISSEGFIGNKIVVIYEGTPGSPSVADEDFIVVQNGLNTDEILATFQSNNKNLLDITTNFKEISTKLKNGEGSIGKLLSDETLANNLEVAMVRLNQASANAQKLTYDISRYTAALQSEGSLTNDLITDTVIFSRLRETVTQLKTASASVTEVTDNIKAASGNIKTASSNLNNSKSPIGVLLNDEEAGKNFKMTLANLQTGTQKLDENLEAMQHNFLLRGFFKKKEKEEEKKIKAEGAKVKIEE